MKPLTPPRPEPLLVYAKALVRSKLEEQGYSIVKLRFCYATPCFIGIWQNWLDLFGHITHGDTVFDVEGFGTVWKKTGVPVWHSGVFDLKLSCGWDDYTGLELGVRYLHFADNRRDR